MRSFALPSLALLGVAIAAVVAACTEVVPPLPATTNDAGEVDGGPLEAEPPAIVAPANRVNASSAPVSFDALRGTVWTANGDVGTVSLVDPVARKVLREVTIGSDVRSVAVSPDGVWVAAVDRDRATVTLLDAGSQTIERVLPVGAHPRACVWDAANPRWLYVSEEDDGAVAVIDRTLGTVVDTIPVGRIPAGLAVSATRPEIYVTHRIDPEVTVVDLSTRTDAIDIPLANEPFSTANIPNGKPMGFESLAVTADGTHAWAPHSLLASTHPFVFDETLFPAISVVDVINRIEQQTNPNSGNTDGRKNLFDAIDILGPDGQPEIFSQLCAVALHPNGFVGWALACGSEDLLTFDMQEGIAIDAIHGIGCDHPAGMTLDALGQRLFVMCDESKQLLTFDTGGGDIVSHTTPYGSPIQVAVDTVAASNPDLRAGRTLFLRANSDKGTLATTGNDWMSCGGCHLDGFGPTNARLFEALDPPANPALDAEIGHIGLVDNFSTVAGPTQSFNPHDVLVALLDQGGLAPDRTGADRTGQVDPSAPTPAATQMAQQLALVVAGDLPAQPSWQIAAGGSPDLVYDGAWCGSSGCHVAEYQAWSQSVHAHAATDSMVTFCVGVEEGLLGSPKQPFQPIARLCAGCHDPTTARTGDYSVTSGRGVTCLGCHDVTQVVNGGGNAGLVWTTHDWTTDHKTWALASLDLLRQPAFCGGCHRQFVPGTGYTSLATLDEFTASPYATSTSCVDCHMPEVGTTATTNHRFPGGNVYLGQVIGDATLVAEQMSNLTNAVQLSAVEVAGGALVSVRNGGAGHWFPTGVADIREPWVELQPKDASGNVLTHLGGPDPATNLLPSNAARLGIDIATADGTILYEHQLSAATRVPFDVRVPSGETQTLFVPVASLPPGTASVDAVLYFRNVRTTYYQAATGTTGAAPSIELARTTVPWSRP